MFEQHITDIFIFFKQNPIVAAGVGVFVAFCFYSKPKESFKLVLFILFLAVAFYIITLVAGALGSGTQHKDRMIYKTEEALKE